MTKEKILYICLNDGSDTRVNKEIKTLSEKAEVIFLGVGTESEVSFIKSYCLEFKVIKGKNRSVITIAKQIFAAIKILFKHKISTIHFINEQSFIFFYPFIFRKYIVLDLFDSIFLTFNKPNNKWGLIKRIIYAPANKIIVTDKNRLDLMPDYLKKKDRIVVLENFPKYIDLSTIKKTKNGLVILYFGTLMEIRGSQLLLNLLSVDLTVKIIAAGWVKDEISERLIAHPNVEFLGVKKQEEMLTICAERCDYIFSVYEPIDILNINASPNKVYDGIMCSTPLIMNGEVKLSSFLEDEKIGYVIDDYYDIDYLKLVNDLKQLKKSFIFSEELKKKNSWDFIEKRLLKAHRL